VLFLRRREQASVELTYGIAAAYRNRGNGRRSGVTFLNTLFDENATCHIAFGAAVMFGAPDLLGLSPDELRERGANVSGVHTDCMIGGPEVAVDGITRDGREIPLFREDVWQLS
jgi:aminopeptidase